MSSFPTSIVSPTDPQPTDKLSSPAHAQQHQSHNAEIVATETKIGTGASTPTAGKVLRGTGTGTSSWGQVDITTDVASATSANLRSLLSDETGTGVAVFGTAPTISAPVITTGTFASPVLTTPQIVTSINDTSGNEIIKTPATASAVNEITITNAATGNAPRIAASGGDSAANLNLRGLGLAKTVTIGGGAIPIFKFDYVDSGCVWTADNVGVNLNASMTAGVVVINGNPVTVALVTARAFTTNVDTYIDVLDNGDTTGLLVYTTAVTNAASPALAANSIRIGIIQAAATITATTKVNQGQEDKVFPIASSIPYAVTDSLGNLICPRDPGRKVLGYRQIIAGVSGTTTAATQATGLSCPVIVPTGRKIKISAFTALFSPSTNNSPIVTIWEGVVSGGGTQKQQYNGVASNATAAGGYIEVEYTPSSTSITLNLGLAQTSSGTATWNAAATFPGYIKVELV